MDGSTCVRRYPEGGVRGSRPSVAAVGGQPGPRLDASVESAT